MKKEHKICKRCIVNDAVPGVKFDNSGVCNYYSEYMDLLRKWDRAKKEES
ncbi:MAG: hypothetical protein KAW56_00075 [Candidatus Marinimicrobia bacterium]|nr:hypothetical protein [Candidatus Neomarinimicrobiota bacterium]